MLKIDFEKDLPDFRLRIDFELHNQICVLWGHSGAGKTTALECLAGLRKPDQGEIVLHEQILFSSTAGVNLPARLRHIGYLFQDHNLFPHLTVEQNIQYGIPKKVGNGPKSDPRQLMEQFGIEHLTGRYPHEISGGERQRAALIRALVTEPRLLLLDEPFSSLDRKAHINLRNIIRYLHQQWNIPVIIVSHDQEDAEVLGQTVISLDRGAQIASNWA